MWKKRNVGFFFAGLTKSGDLGYLRSTFSKFKCIGLVARHQDGVSNGAVHTCLMTVKLRATKSAAVHIKGEASCLDLC